MLLTLSVVAGCGEVAAVESAVLVIGVLRRGLVVKKAVQSLRSKSSTTARNAPEGSFQIYSLLRQHIGPARFSLHPADMRAEILVLTLKNTLIYN